MNQILDGLVIDLTRHCHTAAKTVVDADRMPDGLGIRQISNVRARLYAQGTVYNAGFHSPLIRARLTLEGIAGDSQIPMIPLDVLVHDKDPDKDLLNSAFDKTGSVSLKECHQKATSEEMGAIYAFGKRGWNGLKEELMKLPESTKRVIVLSHAVLTPSIATAATLEFADKIFEINLGECQTIRLTFNNGVVVGVEHIK